MRRDYARANDDVLPLGNYNYFSALSPRLVGGPSKGPGGV
jgi:hypothetical protein